MKKQILAAVLTGTMVMSMMAEHLTMMTGR